MLIKLTSLRIEKELPTQLTPGFSRPTLANAVPRIHDSLSIFRAGSFFLICPRCLALWYSLAICGINLPGNDASLPSNKKSASDWFQHSQANLRERLMAGIWVPGTLPWTGMDVAGNHGYCLKNSGTHHSGHDQKKFRLDFMNRPYDSRRTCDRLQSWQKGLMPDSGLITAALKESVDRDQSHQALKSAENHFTTLEFSACSQPGWDCWQNLASHPRSQPRQSSKSWPDWLTWPAHSGQRNAPRLLYGLPLWL